MRSASSPGVDEKWIEIPSRARFRLDIASGWCVPSGRRVFGFWMYGLKTPRPSSVWLRIATLADSRQTRTAQPSLKHRSTARLMPEISLERPLFRNRRSCEQGRSSFSAETAMSEETSSRPGDPSCFTQQEVIESASCSVQIEIGNRK